MWGTYGANHTGAVVELYTEAQKWPMASDLRSAIYTEHRLPVCPSRLIGIDDRTRAPVLDFEVLRMLLCAKHMDWRDENEWRLVMLAHTAAAAADRLIPLPRSAIAHVFLGPHISEEDEERILKTERPPVTCARSNSYCGRRSRPTAPPAPPARAGSFVDPKSTLA